ncbi:RNA-binding S4 domain-containing protein [Prevotella hominis]|uniref:pseudouridine synthase n=1 Tax=Segatella hominis TaxID=2518605 RepID=UPI001F258897|nr:pseudouridine synthase [Segatella hominis]MCF2590965.1 RNA-binding S4 domain-containing protein [Segatella hominis]
MDSEIENKAQGQSTESEGTREGGYNPAGGYQRNYHSNGRPQRPRINSQRAYSSDRGSSNSGGGFRPEGFGAGLLSSNGEHSQQRGGYQPRGGYGRPQGGGYNNNRAGGYQPRQQAGGYRPRYNNNNNDAEGGYQPRQQGGYQARQQGGYQPRQQGGYQNRQQGGGYNNNRGGGYNNNRGGYNNNRGGGYRQHTPGYDPNAKYSLKKRIEYKEENFDPTEPLRLNKFLANAGVCSRREADEFIQAGVVTVNGEVVTELGTKILRTDEVKFHDAPVSLEKKVYVLLNKPKDYVTTSDDPQQRKTVMDLVKDVCPERIYPVGRLDRNTTGVLLLTNDGDLASKLTHPKFLKKKVYHVHLDKNITAHDLQQIRDGITLDDGEIKADAVDYADERDKSQVGIEIHSGKNRIVRRIFESLGYRVTKLDRVQFAGLTKKNLRRGDWRFLTEKEVDMLRMGAFE